MDVYFNVADSGGSSAHLDSLGDFNVFYQNTRELRLKCCDFLDSVCEISVASGKAG
jgi:hypothetical protein